MLHTAPRMRSHSFGELEGAPPPASRTFPDYTAVFQSSVEPSGFFRPPQKKNSSAERRNWNDQKEQNMRWLGQRAGGFRFLHGRAARWFDFRFKVVGIGSIVLNAIAAGLNIPSVIQCQSHLDAMKYVAIILSIIVCIVMGYQQLMDYGSKKTNHLTSEANYSGLYDTIKNELEKRRSARQDADDFVEWITKQFSDLKSSSPLIPMPLMTEYRKMIAGQHIADPEGIDEIIVNRDESESSTSTPKAPDVRIQMIEESPVPTSSILSPVTSEGTQRFMTPADRIAFERWREQ